MPTAVFADRVYCYAEVAVFFHIAVAVTIANIHFKKRISKQTHSQADFGLGDLVKYKDGIPASGHPSHY